MNIEEAINTAIEYETRVRDVYVEALDEATDKVARRIFKLLADEEHSHIITLKAKLGEWVTRQRLSLDDLDTALPSVETIQSKVEKLEDTMNKEDYTKELNLLEKIREVESETSRFYKQMVDELPTEGRDFFGRFLELEKGHIALVQAEIDSLKGTGFWFDMPEFTVGS
ncbi:MAG: hypothetical protein GY847_33305 [Proteobacteria bacterium]|nr:hypothetical protein [Pseudomonadota bacterium]